MKCEICEHEFDGLLCSNKWCNQEYEKCCKCKKICMVGDMYEYRGSDLSCVDCIDEVSEIREFKRQEIIAEERSKTDKFKGLDLGDNVIGKANRNILKASIDIASKESGRLKDYEGRNDD